MKNNVEELPILLKTDKMTIYQDKSGHLWRRILGYFESWEISFVPGNVKSNSVEKPPPINAGPDDYPW